MPRKTKKPAAAAAAVVQTAKLLTIAPELRNEIYALVAQGQDKLVFVSTRFESNDVSSVFRAAIATHPLSQTCCQAKQEFIAISVCEGAKSVNVVVPNFGVQGLQIFQNLLESDLLKTLKKATELCVATNHLDADAVASIETVGKAIRKKQSDFGSPFGYDTSSVARVVMKVRGEYKSLLVTGKPLPQKEFVKCKKLVLSLFQHIQHHDNEPGTGHYSRKSVCVWVRDLYTNMLDVHEKDQAARKQKAALQTVRKAMFNDDSVLEKVRGMVKDQDVLKARWAMQKFGYYSESEDSSDYDDSDQNRPDEDSPYA